MLRTGLKVSVVDGVGGANSFSLHTQLFMVQQIINKNFTRKLSENIHPGTGCRKFVGPLVSDRQFAPKITVQRSWWSVQKLP